MDTSRPETPARASDLLFLCAMLVPMSPLLLALSGLVLLVVLSAVPVLLLLSFLPQSSLANEKFGPEPMTPADDGLLPAL